MNSTLRCFIPPGLSDGVKSHLDAVMRLHAGTLASIRDFYSSYGYVEVTDTSLADIAELCAPRRIGFDLTEGSSAQRYQYQLELLAHRLGRAYFTKATVKESVDSAAGNTSTPCSLFSALGTVESVIPVTRVSPELAFDRMLTTVEECIKYCVNDLVDELYEELTLLGGDLNYLSRVIRRPFIRLSYDEALSLLSYSSKEGHAHDAGINIRAERELLLYFCNMPVFVSQMPTDQRDFHIKRNQASGRAYVSTLILPKVGASMRTALLEEKADQIRQASAATCNGGSSVHFGVLANSYLKLFDGKDPGARGSISLSFERLLGFLQGNRLI